jgi:hypothetical protein
MPRDDTDTETLKQTTKPTNDTMAEKSTATKTLENIKLNPPTPFTGK